MVADPFIDSFVIDATFLLADAENAFLGSVAIVDECGQNTSVVYGAVRGLLQLRKILGIVCGIVVVGDDANRVSSPQNINMFCDLLRGIGSNVLHEPTIGVGSLFRSLNLQGEATWIVTRNSSPMQLVASGCGIILTLEGSAPEVITEKTLASRYHISAMQVPSFIALTEVVGGLSLTKKQAVRLLEIYGTLGSAFDSAGTDLLSPKVQRYINSNKAELLSRMRELTIVDHIGSRLARSMGTIVRDDGGSRRLLRTYGMPSLGRLLGVPPKIELVGSARIQKRSYIAVVDQAGLREMELVVANAVVCAVDTESTGKDPRRATLLGVAISVSEGSAFYVPLTQVDLRDVTSASALGILRNLLTRPIKVVGHNLKYDYVLLRRHGIQIQEPYFDTMLAAYECFGDWDFFNLGAVAKKLLGRDVKRYRDIVAEGQTLQDIPFADVVEHGCADVDTALTLYGHLRAELIKKSIYSQFVDSVMPLVRILGDKEIDGVSLDILAIKGKRQALSKQSGFAEVAVFDLVGKQFDLDSMQDIATVLRGVEGVRDKIGLQPLRLGQLEQLAQRSPVAKSVVQFRRLKKQISLLDAICKEEKDGKIFPIFSQMKASRGRILSSDPNLFETESALQPEAVLDVDIRQYLADERRALDVLQQLTMDQDLEMDLKIGQNDFISRRGELPLIVGLSHVSLLVSLATNDSNATICKKFLVDARKASDIREVVTSRYPSLFTWIDEFKRRTLSAGFALVGERRRYLEGLGSSDIDKRGRAMRSALRWVIGL